LPVPNLERRQSILNLLKDFKGIDPLKKLFWTELNYDRINKALSRRGWKDNVANLLADDPILLASGANDFQIIYCRLASDKLLMGDERPVVSKLLQEHPYALFVFSNSKQEYFHFLNVKYDDDVQKRRLFRRITVGQNERLRTASERIELLDLADIRPDLFGLSPLAVQQRHDEAFDVELVTKEFFSEYHRIFTEIEESIIGFGRDKERRHLFTQRLFNRLMFIAFIEKKGWLKFNGDADYLTALWKAHQKDNSASDKNFYRDRLKPLFFFGLNSSNEVSQIGINKGAFLKTLIGDVPYLNGGLFEEDDDDKDEGIKVSDKAIGAVLNDLFAKFNFTVTESTPLDVEVAVDPEMLGKIFEELVTGRHESGSYYTPKPIVSFMCREALKGYLETNTSGESKAAIERFVEKQEPDDLLNAETVLDALRKVTVCDPACGSGAYLLGMLHELLDLRAALFQSKKLGSKSVYDRKLEIIQSNVYGVDIDPFAVNIARLRLWLSLAVDFEGAEPEPLPNLDYKLEVGDSLLGSNPSGGLELGFRKQLIDEFLKLKTAFLKAHHGDKGHLKRQIEKVRADIFSFMGHKNGKGFDWCVEFAEVFAGGGFDVVLANPPYVRMELFKDIKPQLRANFPLVHSDRADLYCYFYARAVELLKTTGMLSFISPNKWFRAKYGTNLRLFLSSTCEVISITDFGELPVFDAATFPMIFVAQKGKATLHNTIFTQVRSLDSPYPNIRTLIENAGQPLSHRALDGGNWNLSVGSAASTLLRLKQSGITLAEYVNGDIFYGIKSGLNRAFIIDATQRKELIAENSKCKRAIQPFLVGDNIRKWRLDWDNSYLLYMYHGIDLTGLEPIVHFLRQFRRDLEQRATNQEWYELQQPQFRYAQSFAKPKIVFPDIAKSSRFTFDKSGYYVDTTGFVIPRMDFYLLGILNSRCVWYFLSETAAVLGDPTKGGRLRLKRMYVESIPIPRASDKEKKQIENLVSKCLDVAGDDCASFEDEIEEKVARLFDVKLDDVSRREGSLS
jgi:hypothetical protein